MASVENYPFTTPGNYTYPASVEITGGKCSLKSLRVANAIFGAGYSTNVNASWGDGVLTGSGTGTPVVASGKLQLNSNNTWMDYAGAGNLDGTAGAWTIEFDFYPQYDHAPSSAGVIFTMSKADGDSDNEWSMRQTAIDTFIYVSRDKNGSGGASSMLNATFDPVSGTKYRFAVTYSRSNNRVNLYIDGTKVWTGGITRDRDSSIGLLRFGAPANSGLWNDPEFYIDNIVITPAELYNGATYVPDYTDIADTDYSTDNPVVVFNTTVMNVGSLDGFTETATKTGSDELKYTVEVDGQQKYWNGGSWVNSDGTYAQASTASDINTNAGSLSVSASTLKFRMLVHSDDGSTTPEADLIKVDYTQGATTTKMDCTPFYW